MTHRILRGSLRGLNEIIHIRHLQHLHSKWTVNIKYYYNCFDKPFSFVMTLLVLC